MSTLSFSLLLVFISSCSSFNTFRSIHKLMNNNELTHFFGVDSPSEISPDQYEVVYIHRYGEPRPFDYRQLLEVENAANPRTLLLDEPVYFEFSAYGKEYNLKVKVNDNLAAAGINIVKKTQNGDLPVNEPINTCHFLLDGEDVVAALSHCNEDAIRGYVIDRDKSFELRPLTPRLRSLVPRFSAQETLTNITKSSSRNGGFLVGPHIVRPVDALPDFLEFSDVAPVQHNGEESTSALLNFSLPEVLESRKNRRKYKQMNETREKIFSDSKRAKTVELGLFVDEAACNIFMPYLNYSDKAFIDLILAYVNGMQALYHLPSLGVRVDLTIVNIEILSKQPRDLPTFDGERGPLLNSFCQYNKKVNPPGDGSPGHWDIGLYVSGLDFFAVQNGRRNFITMGLSTVTGVCTDDYNCVIGEFGSVNRKGQLYPSTGFTAIYVMAHEIGHNLGMFHDSTGNSCPPHGFIMSPSRGVVGETKWSTCSASTIASLKAPCLDNFPAGNVPLYDHEKYKEKPGQLWTPDDQCRLLLRDRNAVFLNNGPLRDICDSLKCKTPNRDGTFFAGPALEGTACSEGYSCHEGDCVQDQQQFFSSTQNKDESSHWQRGSCQSGCLFKSIGTRKVKQPCSAVRPMDNFQICEGFLEHSEPCNDAQVCSSRISSKDFATRKCREFSQSVSVLDPRGSGIQVPYSSARKWQSCAIFCKRIDTSSWYTPRLDLNDIDSTDAYFPDGTWCHNDGSTDYYCLEHQCVPEDQLRLKDKEESQKLEAPGTQPLLSSGAESGSGTVAGTANGTNTVNSQGMNPGTEPGTSPGTNSGTSGTEPPRSELEITPGTEPGTSTEVNPEENPEIDTTTSPGTEPGTGTEVKPGENPEINFIAHPATVPGTNPGTSCGTNPDTNFVTYPATNPGTYPGTSSGTSTEVNPGENPEINFIQYPATTPATIPGTDSGTSPEINLITYPALVSIPGTSFGFFQFVNVWYLWPVPGSLFYVNLSPYPHPEDTNEAFSSGNFVLFIP